MIDQGEIYLADLDFAGRRPVVVISREELNRGKYVLVAICTSAQFEKRRHLANCVPCFAGEFGFTLDCVVQCENVLSLEITELDMSRGVLGKLDNARLRDVIRAFGWVVDADCEPV